MDVDVLGCASWMSKGEYRRGVVRRTLFVALAQISVWVLALFVAQGNVLIYLQHPNPQIFGFCLLIWEAIGWIGLWLIQFKSAQSFARALVFVIFVFAGPISLIPIFSPFTTDCRAGFWSVPRF